MWNQKTETLRGFCRLVAIAAVAYGISGCNVASKFKSSAAATDTTNSLPRSLAFVDAPLLNLGLVPAGSTTLVRLSLSTTGNGNATIVSSSNSDSNFTFNGGTFPGTGGTCVQPIQGNCSITVLFTAPATVGLYSNLVTLAYSSAGTPASISVTLAANVMPDAVISINGGSPYAFGTKNVGTATDQTLTVANLGGLNASQLVFSGLSAPINYKGGTYPGTGGTCGNALISGATCTIVITYAPTVAGTTNQTLALAYSDGTSPLSTSIAVSGTAVTLASVSITAPLTSPYDYGNVVIGAPSPSVTVTLSNTGGQSATSLAAAGLSAPINYKGGAYPGTGGNCGASLAAAGSCNIVVTFTPTVAGLASKTLDISFNDGSGSTTHLTQVLQGTGLTAALLTLSDAAIYDFGSQVTGSTTNHTFTLSNSGGTTATAMTGGALSAPYSYKGGTYPGTGGTCAATLAASATCTVVVSFAPVTAGVFNQTLTIPYNDGVSATTSTRSITGTGTLPPASLSITTPAANPYDYGTVFIGAPGVDLTVTLSNSGGQSATSLLTSGLSGPFNYKGGTYPGTGGTCGASLAAAATCTIIVTFLPSSPGSVTETLAISYNNGSTTQSLSRPLVGNGQTPATLGISDGLTYDFASHATGTTTTHIFTVTNSGAVSATAMNGSALAAPYSFQGGTYPGTGGNCGATLAASATCTIAVSFAPVAASASSATLTVNYGNGFTTTNTTRPMTGTGTLPLASVSMTSPVADPYDYGTVTIGAAAVNLTLTLSNSGGQPATSLAVAGVAAPFSFKGGTYPGTGGTCAASLAASATCTMVISFLPTTPVLDTDTLDISYNDGSTTIHLFHDIQGTGGNPALLSISNGATYDFGSRTVGTTTNFTFTVTNSGGVSASTISGAALTAPFSYLGGAFPGTGGSCGTTLAAGATCTTVVSFAPIATGGFTDTLTISYNDGLNATSSVRSLTGTGGTVGNLSISDGPTYNYGSVVKGYTVSKTFTVTNIGGATTSAISGAALSAPYSYLGGAFPGTGGTCTTTLGAAGTCTVLIQYAPTSAVTSNATFTINYNNSVSGTTSARPITGSGATISKIAGGTSHTCALYSTGAVKCWGSNFYGQLGNGTNTNSTVPVSVGGISTATDIAVGANHSCALLSNNRVYCWGADNSGQLGDNASLTNMNSPSQVGLYTDFTQISAGGDTTCGLRSGQTIVCWGNDLEGTLGDNVAFVNQPTPVTVSGLTTMTDVSVGRGHACGRKSDNTFRCWGSNTFGQLGNGTNTTSGTPVTPAPGTALSSAAGGDVSCSLLSGGSVKCWGADDFGQLGDNVALSSKTSPVAVAGLTNVSSIKMGLKHGCALTSTNSIVCWGRDTYGQIGDNVGLVNQPTPVAVAGLAAVASIGVGENHSCGILTSGLVYCWGLNSSSQVGDGTTTNQPTPVLVQGL